MELSKNTINESCSINQIFLKENHFQKHSADFLHRKVTLNIENLQFSRAL
jgi:hypothetical protein